MASDHLTDTELARLALDGREHPHLTSCSVCAGEVEQLRDVVDRLRAMPDPPDRLLEAATAFYRRRRSLEALIERLAEEPTLLAKAKADPGRVLREAGLEPLPELIEALRETDRGSGDLARRIAAKHLWF
jgi:hypothetical protein